MSKLQNINIELIGIGKALLTKRLAVPIYQRSYAWEDKHVLDLFTDVSNAISKGESEYFIGSIVTTKNDTSRPEVVDGQQRLATTAILIAAIRDHFFNLGDLDRATTISSTYLQTKDLTSLEVIPRIQMNSSDNEFFVKRVLTDPSSADRSIKPTKDSHRKIAQAAELARKHVAHLATNADSTKLLVEWVNFVEHGLRVIWVAVSDDANAFTIFETLNDRGLDLAISDLLKNYLFGLAGNRLPEVQEHWIAMIGTIEAVDREDVIVTFIRHLWSSKYGITRERDLYADIKKKVKAKSDALSLSGELSENAKIYAAILNQDHELWQKYGPTARQHMATLNLLQMTQIRPLLLTVLHKFSPDEVQTALRLMVSWATRFLITGGLGGGTLETHYSQRAKEVRDGGIRTASQLSAALKTIIPSDSEFKSAFSVATVSKNYLARYYLRALERQTKGEKDPELVPNDNTEAISLEHVLPMNPSPAWAYISEDDRLANIKRLGNLALLKTRINTDVGNDSFAFKKTFYTQSAYSLTSSIGQYAQWDVTSIADRQQQLADLAIKAWPLK
jgi:uncharacterized protein with ParB-like and HNH nuclease domain